MTGDAGSAYTTVMQLDRQKLTSDVAAAVAHFWTARKRQARTQKKRRSADQGARAAVTGGSQMDGFINNREMRAG